ncbi:MAG: hypothetical protein NTX79_02520 [Candidatus Micrarchaeota archaeon]|nr:hypothetical protein [Candidatus Micrarchaeota archaeon]
MESELFRSLDGKWKSTMKILLGEEFGSMKEYEKWLLGRNRPRITRKSAISGKEVSFVLPDYPQSRILSLEEIDFQKSFAPLSINEVKDIDSIAAAVKERAYYTGNIHLGNSKFIEGSTDIIESFYIYDSGQVSFSKYIAYGYNLEYSECVFGAMNYGNSSFCTQISNAIKIVRSLEMYSCFDCQDSYYSHRLFNCKNTMFCFNLRNASHAIGNLKLAPDKYTALKKKLVSEMAAELKKNKSLPSLIDIVGDSAPDPAMMAALRGKFVKPKEKPVSRAPIEKAFQSTTGVIFGKPLAGIEKYGAWLSEHIRETRKGISALSGEEFVVANHAQYFRYPKSRLVGEEESLFLGAELALTEKDLEGLSLKNVGGRIGKIAFFRPGYEEGKLSNNIESIMDVDVTNAFRSVLNLQSKNCAYNYYMLECESMFGCNSIRKSAFLVRCYNSARMNRCFEVDSSRDCSDAYFCQNCENVQSAMFSFNLKNKRNVIGNAEYSKEEYAKIKNSLCAQIVSELEKTHALRHSIFTIGKD